MPLIRPFWFAQRQGKAEEAGANIYKLTGPNLPATFIGIRPGAEGWVGFVRNAVDGPDLAVTTEPLATEYDAWEAAFERYRTAIII